MNTIHLNDTFSIDLPTLIDTRLLVQANSGGGKSWLLRRLLEQSHGTVQQIVFDLEGEFSTLRERYDYILAAPEGDTPADPRSAALLARRLLELHVSAIIDLYELSHQERKRFVRLFLNAMVNASKHLWHPCLVIIDEAHVFCPQTGQSEAMEAVIDLATRGRKRGYCAVLASQRLSKLHKDAVAEMNNKLIGRTGLDIDRKRAAEELGFTAKDDALSLRNLAPGEFYAFGPAISQSVEKMTVGPVVTSHPKAGARITTRVTPPTDKIRHVIAQLADLPQEAMHETLTIETLHAENTELKRRIALLEKQRQPTITPTAVTVEKPQRDHTEALRKIQSIIAKELGTAGVTTRSPALPTPAVEKPIAGGAQRMLQVLASQCPMTFTKSQLALLSKLSPKSGTYGTYVSTLRSRGFIEGDAAIRITDTGMAYIGSEKPKPQSQEAVLEMWRNTLPAGAQRMFDVLVDVHPRALTKVDLGERTSISYTSGTFGTYVSLLRRNGLADVTGNYMKANPDIFVPSASYDAKEIKR